MRPDTEEIYDLYLDACLAGDVEDPDTFCERFPDITPRLRGRLAALHLLMLEGRADSAEPRLPLEAEEGLPFERLGEFRLVRRIERGGMGLVFLAEQESLARPVALKIVRPELQASPTAVERFRREALAVARLNHPNIVRVFAMGEDHGVGFIAMELVPGRSLQGLLDDGVPPVPRAVRWMLDLARALDVAHREGIVHRDVKPGNIRITPDDRPMLLDFGVARDEQWRGKTLTQAFTGSPLYAAPEQLRGAAVDGRADVYGLGVTLYQCLTGRVPFEGGTIEHVVTRALTEDPAPPRRLNPAISRDLDVVTRKALARDPAQRYPSAAAFADDLQALLEFRPIRARPPGAWKLCMHWCRRHPGPAGVLATLLLALVAVALWANLKRKADARDLVARAERLLQQYRDDGARVRTTEEQVTRLQKEMHARYMTREEEDLLEAQESAVARSRRAREEAFYEVFDLLRRAEQHDPDVPGVDDVRAALYFEKWKDARTAQDPVAEELYRDLVARHDGAGRFDRDLRGGGESAVYTNPSGADVYLFRFEEQASVVPGGEHRLVPVPVAGTPPVPPGTWALRVVRGAAGVEPLDLVLEVAGHPVRDSVLVVSGNGRIRVGDRLESVDGAAIRDLYDVDVLGVSGEPRSFVFERGGARFTMAARSLADLGVRCGSPAELAEAGGADGRLYHMGDVRTTPLPRGLVVRTTAIPLFLSPACRIGSTPFRHHFDAADYLLVYRLAGHEDVIVVGPRSEAVPEAMTVYPNPVGTTPPGFLYIAAHSRDVFGFWIMEREVTAGEYLEFLNDPATLRRIDSSPEPLRFPRSSEQPEGDWPRTADGRYGLPADWTPDMPVLGVSFEDAVAYAQWRSARSDGFKFGLPTKQEWFATGFGQSDRQYPFGDRFRPKWVKSNYSRPQPCIEPVMRFPIDESPSGAYDMSGSAMEWLDDWFYEAGGQKIVAGGAWGQAKPEMFKFWGNGARPTVASGSYGFRLVMRRKGP